MAACSGVGGYDLENTIQCLRSTRVHSANTSSRSRMVLFIHVLLLMVAVTVIVSTALSV